MIKTIETHNGMKISLQSDFTKIPEGECHLTLEIQNDAMARKYMNIILEDMRQMMGILYAFSNNEGTPKACQRSLEATVEEYNELLNLKGVINNEFL